MSGAAEIVDTGSYSVPSILPQEILQYILQSVFRCNRATLKACSLVNKAWRDASHTILFRSIDLTSLLAKDDWLSLFINIPFSIGDHIREIMVKNARWPSESNRTRGLLLSHFAMSVTCIKLSNLVISDFADFTSVVSILKGLQALSLHHVEFESNRLGLFEPIAPNRTLPPSVTSIAFYSVDLGLLLDWIHAHSTAPKLSKIFFGPVESRWKMKTFRNLLNALHDRPCELGILYPDTSYDNSSQFCSFTTTKDCPPPPNAHLQKLIEKHQARYGLPLHLNSLPFSENLRTLRLHKFFTGKDCVSDVPTIWAPKTLVNVKKGFRGRVVLDVEAKSASEIDVARVDWQFLEDILEDEIFSEVEAVVFLALTDIDIVKLESYISVKMPRSYTRGILRFEEANEATIRPPNIM